MIASPASRFGAALLMIVAMVAGCQTKDGGESQSTESAFVNWPDKLSDFRFRWGAEPDVDLLSGPAVPLRAYLESHRIGDMTGDARDAYPGFARAVPHSGKPRDDSRSDLPKELWNIQPATDFLGVTPMSIPSRAFYGNEYFHVLELKPISEGRYRAFVCDGRYNIFHDPESTGTLTSLFSEWEPGPDQELSTVRLWRVEFTDHSTPPMADAPAAVVEPQDGPSPAPLDDVFGPWQITGATDLSTWGPSSPHSYDGWQERRKQCLDKMPHDAAKRQVIYTSRLDAPPAFEPAVPGWPGDAA